MWKPSLITTVAALHMGLGTIASGPAAQEIRGHAYADCLAEHDCATLGTSAAIPDNDPAGLTIGPLSFSGNTRTIRDLMVALSVSHPYSGDLVLALHYDADRDGTYDTSSVLEIYLARMNPCEGTELWAYPIELRGTYFFKDEGWQAVGEVASLEVFEGRDADGAFYRTIVDSGAGHTGIVSDWAIYSETTEPAGSKRLMSNGSSRHW